MLEELYAAFEDPEEENAGLYFGGILFPYLSYKLDPPTKILDRLQDYVSGYTSRERREMLRWIAEDERLAKLFQTNLLKFFNDAHNPLEDFTSALSGRSNFMEVIVSYGNDSAVDWVFDNLEEACDGELSCMLKKYCVLGGSMTSGEYASAEDMLDYERYRTFIDKIITEKINKEEWDDQDLEDAGDLKDWGEELCGVEDSG